MFCPAVGVEPGRGRSPRSRGPRRGATRGRTPHTPHCMTVCRMNVNEFLQFYYSDNHN